MEPTEKFLRAAKKIEDDHHASGGHGDHKKEEAAEDESNWLISYADLMTLLVAFFAMMFSMATMEKPKYELMKQEVSTYFGGDYESPNKQLARFSTQVIEESGLSQSTALTTDNVSVTLVIQSAFAFDPLSAEIRAEARPAFDRLIDAVKKRQEAETKAYKVIIEGHTDGMPVTGGIYASNWELSYARALGLMRMFVEAGFDESRVIPLGYGPSRPVVNDRTPAGLPDPAALAKNRRVVIRVLEPDAATLPWDSAAPAHPEKPAH